jgi:hypothetical protein
LPQGAPLLLGNQFFGSLAHRQATPAGTTCRFQHEQKNGVQLLERYPSHSAKSGMSSWKTPRQARACQGHFKDVMAKPSARWNGSQQLQNGMDDDFVQNLTCIFHRKSADKTWFEYIQSNENEKYENTILRYTGGLHHGYVTIRSIIYSN